MRLQGMWILSILVAMIQVISHTHWDREWFVPAGFARAWLVPFFDALFDLLEGEPQYRFVLDGQSILLEDYLLQLSQDARESAVEKIAAYAEEGRLVLGPYYQQPDWQLVSGEALVRNLLIGSADAAALAGEHRSRVGWLMDNFGQIGQTVQIHRGFNMKGIYAWRGFDLLPDRLSDTFRWESYDGSSLPVVYLLDSYRNGMRLFAASEFTERRLTAATDRIEPFSSDGQLLLMNGYDQEMEPENIPKELGRLPESWRRRLSVSDPERYLKSKRIAGLRLRGAQRSGRFISVFPGILSARNYLKIANHRAETAMRRYLDPLLALTAKHAPEQVDPDQLRRESDLLWRLVLQNHPHDTICGVSSDPVQEETELRLAEIEQRQLELLRRLSALLSKAAVASDKINETYFNPSLFPRRTIIRGADGKESLSSPIPPLSLAFAAAEDDEHGSDGESPWLEEQAGAYRLSNGLITALFSPDGSLTLREETSGVVMRRMLAFRDTGDAGDSYSEDRVESDARQEFSHITVERTDCTLARASIDVRAVLELPAALERSRRERSREIARSDLFLRLEIRRGEPFLRIAITLLNRSRDHRLQLRFSSGRPSGRVLSLTQFAWEEPAGELPSPGDTSQPAPEVSRLMLGAREPELSRVFPTAGALAGGDDSGALLVAQEGLFEGELLGGGDFGLTLLRSVGWLARSDLHSRTGDAGPEIFAPKAQCLGAMETRLAIAPLPSLADATGPRGARLVEAFSAPVLHLPADQGEASASANPPARAISLLEGLSGDDGVESLYLSTAKLTEPRGEGESFILRLFNPWKEPVVLPTPLQHRGTRVRLDETTPEEGREPGALGPFEIGTLRFADLASEASPARGPRWKERFEAALTGKLPYRRFGREHFTLPPDAWSWLFGRASARMETTSEREEDTRLWISYLEEGVAEEEGRLRRLEKREAEAKASYEEAKREDPQMERPETILRRSASSTAHRQRLEAELSLLFLEWTFRRTKEVPSEAEREALYRKIEELALELNHARVAKRADDYLVALVPVE